MNSEELELSLRTEFESYLNGVFGRLRQEVSDFQKTFETEFERQKAQMEQAFQDFSSRLGEGTQFDKAFTESVTEHLRLARDEGAKIAESALAEAAKLDGGAAAQPAPGYDKLRDAISDIGSRNSQSTILTSLVEHASEFTPRGAFFIVRNDQFVCWKLFGKGTETTASPDLQFSALGDTILADAVRSLATREAGYGRYEGDAAFLDSLGFGQPDRMYAIPLTARGRGVAVLYADYGSDGVNVNVEAIETLVRVAGLTVELQAASQAARMQVAPPAPAETVQPAQPQTEQQEAVNPAAASEHEQYVESAEASQQHEEHAGGEGSFDSEADADRAYSERSAEEEETAAEPASESDYSFVEPVSEEGEQATAPVEDKSSDFAFTPTDQFETSSGGGFDTIPSARVEFETAGTLGGGHAFQTVPQAVVEQPVETVTTRSRFSRNLDLPIEVAENERKLHNDARRFARLLVSEIKLYNEQQVKDARDSGEIYTRLRDAIDRSREMYDNRVKPEVAAKFDYFHYELVNGLADGNAARLGPNYPGAAV